MKIYFKYYGEALAKVAVGGFLIGMEHILHLMDVSSMAHISCC